MKLRQEVFDRRRLPNDGLYECPICGRPSQTQDLEGVLTINGHTNRVIRTDVQQIRARCPVGHEWMELER